MATFPSTIPALPLAQGGMTWPANLLIIFDSLSDIYGHALHAWNQEDADPLRLNFHLAAIEGSALELLGAIEGDPISTWLSHWLVQTTKLFGKLHSAIASYWDNIQNKADDTVQMLPHIIMDVQSGLRGRPRKIISTNFLAEAIAGSRQISYTELARVLGIHRNTLRHYMKNHGLERRDDQNLEFDISLGFSGSMGFEFSTTG
ncbi:hypothetical protein EDD17DRAFT_1843524 [Pisolithus thermaeus]|nr:hypothetical protein EDD17DRAFT_1843524 [Pisolithus thermaeus]